MKKNYKIAVIGLGYVGLANAVLLAQHNEVIGVDILQERVDLLNAYESRQLLMLNCRNIWLRRI